MSLLAHLKRDDSIQGSTDRGNYTPLTTDVYSFTIESAYLTTSNSGATGVVFSFKSPTESLRETIYITSGKEKGALPYYVDKRTSEKKYLPGYILFSDICRLSVDKEIHELSPEEKIVKVYNKEQSKEVPTSVQMLTELLGTEIKLGVLQVMQDKYQEPTEFISINSIDKTFHNDTGLTVTEAEAGMEEGEFINKWLEVNKDKVADKRKMSKEGATPTGTTRPSHNPDTPFTGGSLFAKKK